MKEGIIIAISRRELFIDGAKLILEQIKKAGVDCQIIFIEDYFKHSGHKENRKKIFYFLANIAAVEACAKYVLRKGHGVINEKFLYKEKSKFYLQKTIKQYGVIIPKSACPTNKKDTRRMDFPCYIKNQQQASTVMRVADKKELDDAIHLFNCNNEVWYLEEAIEGDDVWLQKIYYVDGKIFARKTDFFLGYTLTSISKALNLEVFSVDIFSSNAGGYWVIDVNPAPSFFNSNEARENFASFLLSQE